MAALFYKAPFIGEPGATCVLSNISRKTAGFVEYIIYILIYHSFFILDKGGIPYEEEYYLGNGRGGFGLRAGLGL